MNTKSGNGMETSNGETERTTVKLKGEEKVLKEIARDLRNCSNGVRSAARLLESGNPIRRVSDDDLVDDMVISALERMSEALTVNAADLAALIKTINRNRGENRTPDMFANDRNGTGPKPAKRQTHHASAHATVGGGAA